MNDIGLSKRAKEIFAAAIGLDPASRSGFVKGTANGDLALIAEVESWLASYSESEGFIEAPIISFKQSIEGKQFGSFEIVREIARGGMGAVFLAKRSDGEFEQQVALKIIRQTFADPHLIERFRRERQILATLNHPNVARLLDGGVTDDGEPFVVMEYVNGVSLLDFARSRDLNLNARLLLFIKLCSAVAHAHRNLIVHRDIKPANILITSDGEPKLLDFGVAKLLDDGIAAPEQTATMFRALTPAYASPEQLRGSAISTATDIYSLGLVLYELLTGDRPFDREGMAIAEMLKTVETAEPSPPSKRAGADGLRSQLRGDLDNIILTALAREPERRYASVESLARDIERHLSGLPVNARPSTIGYRSFKFISRHKAAVATAAFVLTVLIAAVFISLWQARVAARERDSALQERQRAEQVSSFLRTVLSSATPEEKGRDAKVIEVLDDTAARIETEFESQPELKAQVLLTVGSTYFDLGLPDKAEKYLRQSLELHQQLYGDQSRLSAVATIQLGSCLLNLGNLAEAAQLLESGVQMLREPAAGDSESLAFGLFVLGETYVRNGRANEAESLLNESIQIYDRLKGPNNPESAYSYISLGRALDRKKDLDGAEAMFRRSIEIYRSLQGNFEYRKALALFNLGDILVQRSRFDEAILVFNEAFPTFDKMGDSWEKFIAHYYFGKAYFQKREYSLAIDHTRRAVEMAERIKLVGTVDYLLLLNYLGLSLTRTGKPREAEVYLRKFYEFSYRNYPEGDIQRAYAEGSLGECLTLLARYAEAEPLLRSSYTVIRSIRGENDIGTTIAAGRIAELNKRSAKTVVK